MSPDHDPAPSESPGKPTYSSTPSPSPSSTKALIGILLAGIAGMIVLAFVHLSKDGHIKTGAPAASAECAKGGHDCLPDVNYTDVDGKAYTHEQLLGKVVLVNFWATWCHPCQSEIPALSKAYDKYKAKGVVFLGVMTDNPDSSTLLTFQSDNEMSYPVVRSNSDVMLSYSYPDAIPTTYVFDRNGKQVFSRTGALRLDDLDPLLARLAAQQPGV